MLSKPEIPNVTAALKVWDQLVFIHVLWDLSAEHLQVAMPMKDLSDSFLGCIVVKKAREGVKKRIFCGQANRKG